MKPVSMTLDGKEIFGTGCIVGKIGQVIELRPFEEQPDFTIKVKIQAVPGGQPPKSSIHAEGTGVVIEHIQDWDMLANEIFVNRTVFGGDDTRLYCINYGVRLRGSPDNYSYAFDFTLYIERAQ